MNELDGRRTLLAESIDSGEFFLSQLRQKISSLEAKRNNLKAALSTIEAEEKALKVKHSKLNGLVLSQDFKLKKELETTKFEFKAAEELIWESRLEKEQKCKKLEMDIENLKRKRGLVSHPSQS